jgi:putative transcription factor
MAKRTYLRPKREYGIERDCDVCGKHSSTSIALIEGAEVAVCSACAKFGKVLYSFEQPVSKDVGRSPSVVESEDIVEGYARIIKAKREELGLPLAVVAERINEKESYLEKIERGDLLPSLAVAKKLERALGIKLIEKIKEEISATSTKPLKFEEPSLADLLEADSARKNK